MTLRMDWDQTPLAPRPVPATMSYMISTLSPTALSVSVVAVPPLCRKPDLTLHLEENAKLIRHMEAAGVRLFLYGGNANFYNVSLSEYSGILDMLESAAGPQSVVIPSVGPYYGTMLDQAAILRSRAFPTAMVLPATFPLRPAGVATALRHFAERFGRPIVVYIKNDGYITVGDVEKLMTDGCVSWIKYAVVRENAAKDPYLRDLIQSVGGEIVISGMGEQPAIVHMRDMGIAGFTSGCICVAPELSMKLLAAAKAGVWSVAESIREQFSPLENLRNQHGPIPVLHHAVALAEIAETGPHLPLLADLPHQILAEIRAATAQLLTAERT